MDLRSCWLSRQRKRKSWSGQGVAALVGALASPSCWSLSRWPRLRCLASAARRRSELMAGAAWRSRAGSITLRKTGRSLAATPSQKSVYNEKPTGGRATCILFCNRHVGTSGFPPHDVASRPSCCSRSKPSYDLKNCLMSEAERGGARRPSPPDMSRRIIWHLRHIQARFVFYLPHGMTTLHIALIIEAVLLHTCWSTCRQSCMHGCKNAAISSYSVHTHIIRPRSPSLRSGRVRQVRPDRCGGARLRCAASAANSCEGCPSPAEPHLLLQLDSCAFSDAVHTYKTLFRCPRRLARPRPALPAPTQWLGSFSPSGSPWEWR